MGNHTTQQDTDRRGGLVGRGAFTALAALTLLGGGAGVALADEAGQDATQSQAQQHENKASDDQKSSDEQGSDQQGSGQKGSDEGSDQAGPGLPSLPGADSVASLTSLPTSAAARPSAPIVSSILGG